MKTNAFARFSLLVVSLYASGALVAADAAPATNLVVNGSFEGAAGLTGWSIGGTVDDGFLPVAIRYNQVSSYPTGAQGESVPTDDATSPSPDAAGSNGVYFVTDSATNLSLYQTVHLTPGSYDIGFDSYATYNGYVQPFDSNLTATIAGVRLASFSVSMVQPGVWTSHTGEALITAAGDYLVSLAFTPGNGDSKDLVFDRVFVVADADGGGTPIASGVPEPSTVALMFGGLGLIGRLGRRRKSASPSGAQQARWRQ